MRLRFRPKKGTLRFLSVVTGFLIWFYVLNAARVRVEKVVLLQYVLPEHAVFAKRPPAEVGVVLEGPRAFMRQLESREERMVVDLTRRPWRDQSNPRVPLRPEDIPLPFGVRVERFSARWLELRLERKASKVVPVKAPLVGELPSELRLEKLRVRPSEVEVVGPRSLVGSLKEVTTRPVDVESLLGQETISLEWQLPDERLVVATAGTPQLSYELTARRANLVLESVPVRVLGDGRVTGASKVTVVLWAPADLVRRVEKTDLNVQVWAEVPEGKRGQQRVPLRAVLPPRLHLVELRPSSVLVEGP